MNHLLGALLVMLLLASVATLSEARAEAKPASAAFSNELSTIVVTGTRTEHTLADSPVLVEVISREDIERSGSATVADLLKTEAGVYVVPEAGRGTRIEMQGFGSEHVLVLVNGQRINGRINGAIDLRRLKTAGIEQVEIVKGPSSALYGSDALGGVINIISSTASRGGALTARLDSAQNYDVSGLLGWQEGALSGQLNAGVVTTNPFDIDPATPGEDGLQSEARFFNLGSTLVASDRLDVNLRFEYQIDDQARELRGTGGAVFDIRKRVEDWRVGLEPVLQLGAGQLKVSAYYSRYYDQFVQDQRGDDSGDADERTTDDLTVIGGQFDQPLGNHLLTVGAEAQLEKLSADRLGTDGERDRQSLYVQDDWQSASGKLTVVPGLRYDRDSQFGSQTSPKLALRYDLNDALLLRAGYGHGFRAPDFKQLLLRFENASAGYRVDGNPDLVAEKSRSGTIGFEWRGARWGFVASGFLSRADDLIEIVPGQPQGQTAIFTYRNVERARLYGIDTSVKWRPRSNIDLTLSYGYLQTEDEQTGEPLSGRPENRVGLDGFITLGRFGFGARGQWVDERVFGVELDSGGPPTGAGVADDYALLDLRTEWNAAEGSSLSGLTVALGLDNVFDEGDSQFLPIQPRHGYLEIRKAF